MASQAAFAATARPSSTRACATGARRALEPRARFVVVGLLVLVAGFNAACSRNAEATSEAPPLDGFSIVSPTIADAVHERAYVADVRAKQRVEVRSRIKGFIESVAVDEGQAVEKGQLLFTINVTELKQQDTIARASARRAEAELKIAELERDGTRMLFDEEVVSEAELALAESKVSSLRALLEEARATRAAINLEYARVLAPFDGVVNRIPLRAGSAVDDQHPLTTITDTSEVFAYFRVSESEYLEYTSAATGVPQEVWLRLADGSVYSSPGMIDAMESEFDRDTGSIAFRARFPNESGRLKHGSSGTVIVRTDLRSALLVPQRSTFEIQEQLYVYVVDDDNTARARRILPKLRLNDSFVVASGLERTDQFVFEGVHKLRDGMTVRALPVVEAHGS